MAISSKMKHRIKKQSKLTVLMILLIILFVPTYLGAVFNSAYIAIDDLFKKVYDEIYDSSNGI
jgi:uncharacterized membrane protein YvbJ